MQFRQNKNIFKNILYSWFTLLVLLTISIVLIYNVIGLIKKSKETGQWKEKTARELASLENREDQLQSEIEKFKTQQGIEEKIREKFGVVKEGEEIIVIIDDSTLKGNRDENKDQNSFLKFLKNLFSKK